MPLFSFADISFGTQSFTPNLNVGRETGFSYNTMRYPLDIGSADKGHYMIIYINEQVKTSFSSGLSSERPSVFNLERRTPSVGSGFETGIGVIDSFLSDASSFLSRQASQSQTQFTSLTPTVTVDPVTGGTTTFFGDASNSSGSSNSGGGSLGPVDFSFRKIRRTSKAIALYMPDTLNFQQNQGYQDFSIGNNSFVTGVFAGVSAVDTAKKYGSPLSAFPDWARNLGPFFANSLLGNPGSAAIFGVVANPLLDIIYSSPELRTFRFDFMFYPRSEREAREVQNIINTLKFHQAPEISPEGAGYFLIPPSEFDIKFFYNGGENPNIPKISTCVLQSIDVDYAPNGFAAYEVPGQTNPRKGGTGTPVATRLSLQFKETLYLTKQYYRDPSVQERGDEVEQLFTTETPVVTETDTGRTTYFGG